MLTDVIPVLGSGKSGRFFYRPGINGRLKIIGTTCRKNSCYGQRRRNVAGQKRRVTEAMAHNALLLAIHASRRFHTDGNIAFPVMRFAHATAAVLHCAAAMTVVHSAGPALYGLRGQGEGEVEYAEKNKHDKRNYSLVTPLHS